MTERLEREIRDARGTVVNGMQMRREHPSYGYTKTMIREELTRLTALIEAHALVTGAIAYIAKPVLPDIREHGRTLGVDLSDLEKKVRDMK